MSLFWLYSTNTLVATLCIAFTDHTYLCIFNFSPDPSLLVSAVADVVVVIVVVSWRPGPQHPPVAEADRRQGKHEEEASGGCYPGHGGKLVTRNLKRDEKITCHHHHYYHHHLLD